MKKRFFALLVLAVMLISLFPTTVFATNPGEELPYTLYCEKCSIYKTIYLIGYTDPFFNEEKNCYYHYIKCKCSEGHEIVGEDRCFNPYGGEYTIAYSQISSSSGKDPTVYHQRTCGCGQIDYQKHNYSAWTDSTRKCADCGYVQTCDHSGNETILCYNDAPCSACGTMLEQTEHSYRSYFACDEENEHHWRECRYCGDQIDYGAHEDQDHDHKCDICYSIFTVCGDADNDHYCDVCSSVLSEHDFIHFDEKDATTSEDGNKEYYYCNICKKYFKDGLGIVQYDNGLDDVVIPKLPVITKGDGQTVTVGEKKALEFISDADFAEFCNCVLIDEKELDQANYTATDGSTIITLSADYVATLAVGEHTIGVVSENGTATAKFTVNKKVEETTEKPTTNDKVEETTTVTDTPAANDDTKSPQTGDNSKMFLWLTLFVSGGAVTAATIAGRKRKYNR